MFQLFQVSLSNPQIPEEYARKWQETVFMEYNMWYEIENPEAPFYKSRGDRMGFGPAGIEKSPVLPRARRMTPPPTVTGCRT